MFIKVHIQVIFSKAHQKSVWKNMRVRSKSLETFRKSSVLICSTKYVSLDGIERECGVYCLLFLGSCTQFCLE